MVYITIKPTLLLKYERIYNIYMKKIMMLLIFTVGLLNASCQSNVLLSYFPDIAEDTIIRTTLEQSTYFKKSQISSLPDTIALKYFFDNDTEKMYGEEEGYNVDDNTYISISYVKKVYPLFKKKHENLYLLFYGIKSVLSIAIYVPERDEIVSTLVVSDFSDDMGNKVIHSTIFPNDYIVTTQINEKTYHNLIQIDYNTHRFNEIKKMESKINMFEQEKQFEEAFSVLGISEKGELME